MKIIALGRDTQGAKSEDFTRHLDAEAAKVFELQQQGILRETHFRADRNDAVLFLECATLEEAENALSELPLVKEGLISFEIIPLRPYPGLSRLFRKND